MPTWAKHTHKMCTGCVFDDAYYTDECNRLQSIKYEILKANILQMDVGDENNISDDDNDDSDNSPGTVIVNIENHLQMHVDYCILPIIKI